VKDQEAELKSVKRSGIIEEHDRQLRDPQLDYVWDANPPTLPIRHKHDGKTFVIGYYQRFPTSLATFTAPKRQRGRVNAVIVFGLVKTKEKPRSPHAIWGKGIWSTMFPTGIL
jgi:hypothetical protein